MLGTGSALCGEGTELSAAELFPAGGRADDRWHAAQRDPEKRALHEPGVRRASWRNALTGALRGGGARRHRPRRAQPAGQGQYCRSGENFALQGLGKDLGEIADPGDWAKADIDTRREMLDTANDRIREEYRLPERDVSYRSDMGPDVCGEYNPRTGDISINSSLLEADHPEEAIKTLAHENFHDYQQQAIDGHLADPYAQSRVNDWIEGDANYDSNDFTAYMNNPLEADAYAVEEEVYRGYKGG